MEYTPCQDQMVTIFIGHIKYSSFRIVNVMVKSLVCVCEIRQNEYFAVKEILISITTLPDSQSCCDNHLIYSGVLV